MHQRNKFNPPRRIFAANLRNLMELLFIIMVSTSGHCSNHVHHMSSDEVQTYHGDVYISHELSSEMSRDCRVVCKNANMTVLLKLLIIRQTTDNQMHPLKLEYKSENSANFTKIDIEQRLKGTDYGGLVLAFPVKELSIAAEHLWSNDTAFNVILYLYGTNATISVSCHAGPNRTTDDGTLDYIENVCSGALVIMLGSLSAALLLIILIVSILLCCVMPKKQRREIKKIRQSMLLDTDATFRSKGADRIRPETVIYDDATVQRKTIVDGLEAQPSAPPEHYANSSFTQSRLYQNI